MWEEVTFSRELLLIGIVSPSDDDRQLLFCVGIIIYFDNINI